MECSRLVEKVISKVRLWSTRSLSFAGWTIHIRNVHILGFNLLTTLRGSGKTYQDLQKLLMGGKEEYTRVPHISWKNTCQEKKYGGIRLKDFANWNKATIAKLVWALSKKKDVLWVRWVRGRYLKGKEWWEYKPLPDCSWIWKKICHIKEIFKAGCNTLPSWSDYTVKRGYLWL